MYTCLLEHIIVFLFSNIIEIGIFPGCMSHRCLTYALQQIIAQELEVERLRRASILTGLGRDNVHDAKSSKDSKIVQCTQNKSSNKPNNIKPSEKNVTSLKKVVSYIHFVFLCIT